VKEREGEERRGRREGKDCGKEEGWE